jgi:hypothetical protein
MTQRQITNSVLLIQPRGFGYNEQTAGDNLFQVRDDQGADTPRRALEEFNSLVRALRRAGVHAWVAEPPGGTDLPDAVFPNNWFSTHADGTVVLYPMAAQNRRPERQPALLEWLQRKGGYQIERVVDLSPWENEQLFLEGTGSLVLDRVHQIAYASLSPRTSPEAVERWCRLFDYRPVVFQATHQAGPRRVPVYHTNVMLGLGESWAVVCLQAIDDPAERQAVRRSLSRDGRTLIEIDETQMASFAANILQLTSSPPSSAEHPLAEETRRERSVVVMSQAAFDVLRGSQLDELRRDSAIVAVDVSLIERCGGGSVRCMLAEIFLPRSV